MPGEGWIDPEILDNQTGEQPLEEPVDPDAETQELPEGEIEAAAEGAEEAPAEPDSDREKAGILNELRETRKAMKQERLENAERNRVLEERLATLFEAKESAESQPQAPDPEEDPLGAINYRQEQMAEQQRQLLEQQQAVQQQTVQQQQMQQVAQQIQAQEKSFMESASVDNDVYEAALDYARKEVQSYVESMGYTPEQAAQEAQLEQLRFAAQCMQAGVNPAEARYNLALKRGYQPPAAEPAQEADAEGAPDAPEGEERGADVAKMLNFKKGAVASSTSLSKVSGGAGKRRITMEDLASADAEVFDKITKNPELFEKLAVEGSLDI